MATQSTRPDGTFLCVADRHDRDSVPQTSQNRKPTHRRRWPGANDAGLSAGPSRRRSSGVREARRLHARLSRPYGPENASRAVTNARRGGVLRSGSLPLAPFRAFGGRFGDASERVARRLVYSAPSCAIPRSPPSSATTSSCAPELRWLALLLAYGGCRASHQWRHDGRCVARFVVVAAQPRSPVAARTRGAKPRSAEPLTRGVLFVHEDLNPHALRRRNLNRTR
jgi:hypothetical protein